MCNFTFLVHIDIFRYFHDFVTFLDLFLIKSSSKENDLSFTYFGGIFHSQRCSVHHEILTVSGQLF